jgi:heme/copper-type cytochrome/quinol oxidase subunit 3
VIPYTVDRRADTGVSNVTMGIWLFLASEVMLFGGLFSAYALLRVSAPAWPNGRDVLSTTFGATNTVILFVMTGLMWRARSAATAAAARRGLQLASLLAVAFLAVKSAEYSDEIGRGLVPKVNTFLAMYFTLTGLHALHVICGLVANVWAILGLARVGDQMTLGRVRALALYWAFVDVVWMIIFVLMYLT